MHLRPLAVVVPTLVCMLFAACVGSDPDPIAPPPDGGGNTSTSGGASTSGIPANDASKPADAAADTSDGSTACPTGCVPLGSDGWIGPSAVLDEPEAKTDITCPEPYTEHEVYARTFIPPAQHTCSCPTPISTLACTATFDHFSTQNCTGSASSPTASNCFSLTPPATSFKLKNAITSGACQKPTPVAAKADPKVARTVIACARKNDPACNGRTDCTMPGSLPSPLTRVCIHKDGEVKCPSGVYEDRIVVHRKVVDNRGCDPCELTATGCTVTIPLNTGPGAGRAISSADCVQSDSTSSVQVSTPRCTATAGPPNGQVTPDDPVTFCCTKT